jgi:hypothetical protein
LIISKFVIVATLSLAAGAVSSGTAGSGSHGSGFSSVLAGGALLLMATFVPFAILRMIPAVEAGAVAHLDGLRERGTAAVTRGVPRTAASHALHEGLGALGDARLLARRAAAGGGGTAGEGEEISDSGIPLAQGDPEAPRQLQEAVAQGVEPRPRGPKPVLPAPGSGSPAGASPASGSASGSGSADGDATPEPAAPATGFEPDPAQRVGARATYGTGARLGPATPEDIWMWEGVPPGCGLIRRYQPGERRYYMGHDGGPSLKELDPAWPPDQGPEA